MLLWRLFDRSVSGQTLASVAPVGDPTFVAHILGARLECTRVKGNTNLTPRGFQHEEREEQGRSRHRCSQWHRARHRSEPR